MHYVLYVHLHHNRLHKIQMDASSSHSGRLFGRQRTLYDVLGRGKVADILLWRNTRVSAAILSGNIAIWFLFQVVEYNLVTLLCHIFISTMLVIFIWSTAAEFFKWQPPSIPRIVFQDSTFTNAASTFHKRFNDILSMILYVATGNDPRIFFMTIASLWIISIIGSSISSLNLLFFGILCLETVPFLYEKYEDEVDDLAYQVLRGFKKAYIKFDADFMSKIPRGSRKTK